MLYRKLDGTGLFVSRIALGTMTFGTPNWGTPADEAAQILSAYTEAGGTFIDVADNYAGGESERIVGAFVAERNRDAIVLATKGFFPTGGHPTARGLSRKHLFEAVDASLKRLRTDYIDLYYAHGFDVHAPLEETMAAFDALITAGKVRYIGASNFAAWQLTLANAIAERRNRCGFVCAQNVYNLVRREVEYELIPALIAQRLALVAWSPLAGGLLSGKYRRTPAPEQGTRLHHRMAVDGPRFWHQRGHDVAEILQGISSSSGVSAVELALGWGLSRPAVAAMIIGVRTMEQLRANLRVADALPDAAVLAELTAATAPTPIHQTEFQAHADRTLWSTVAIDPSPHQPC